MAETPKKSDLVPSSVAFTPIILPKSPSTIQRNLTGHPRVVKDLVADLYNTIQKWNDLHIKGAAIVKQIGIIKSDNPSYCKDLENFTKDLYDLVQILKTHRDKFILYKNQLEALSKLEPNSVLFISLNLEKIFKIYSEIVEAYVGEFDRKVFVLEHIAHCKVKHDIMFMAAMWTYQTNVPDNIDFNVEILLIETGHRKIK